jgi:hypothetical protein
MRCLVARQASRARAARRQPRAQRGNARPCPRPHPRPPPQFVDVSGNAELTGVPVFAQQAAQATQLRASNCCFGALPDPDALPPLLLLLDVRCGAGGAAPLQRRGRAARGLCAPCRWAAHKHTHTLCHSSQLVASPRLASPRLASPRLASPRLWA